MKIDRAENISSLIKPSIDRQEGQRFLRFSFNSNTNILVPLADLEGVVNVDLKDILPVPEITKYWLGITNWRGKAIWVLDLANLLGTIHWCERKKVADSGTAMLVQFQERIIGLLVENISTIETYLPEEKLVTLPSMLPEHLRPFLQSYFINSQGRPLMILELHALIHSL